MARWPGQGPFTETDWTDLTGDDVTAYVKSKTLAERRGLDLSVVNPELTTQQIAVLLRERLGAVASRARTAGNGPSTRLREAVSAKARRARLVAPIG